MQFSHFFKDRRVATGIVLLFVSVVLTGCGGGGGSSTASSTTPGTVAGVSPGISAGLPANDLPPLGINTFTIQKAVKVLPSDGSVTLSGVTATSVTLSGPGVPALVPGSVIISNQTLPDGTFGILRKVVSVTSSGGVTTAQTVQAYMDDVFSSAYIHQSQSLPGATVAAALKPGLKGITFGGLTLSQKGIVSKSHMVARPNTDNTLGDFPIVFTNVVIQDPVTGTIIATVNGQIDVSLGAETVLDLDQNIGIPFTDISIPTRVHRFIGAPYLQVVASNLTVVSKVSGTFSRRFNVTDPSNLPSFDLALFGPLSLVGSLQIYAQVDGSFNESNSASIDGHARLEVGLQCTDNQFSFYNPSNESFNVTTPSTNLAGAASLNVSPLQPEFTLALTGLGSAYVRADVLKTQMTFSAGQDGNGNQGYNIHVNGDLRATAGAKIQFLTKVLFDGTYNSPDLSFSLEDNFVLQSSATESAPPVVAPPPTNSGGIGITLQ